ncbi:MAG: 3-carboxy-cis,cis-muconate cycloisomerase [Paracoccaceae bacterium]
MSASVFDHPWLSGLFDAPKISPLWQPDAQIAHIVNFEWAWTKALIKTGRTTPTQGEAALSAIENWTASNETLREGVARDGIVIPIIIEQMRAGLADSDAVHSGATSQDVIDTAFVLTLQAILDVFEHDLAQLCLTLQNLRDLHGHNTIMGRTRMQAALLITVDHRITGWHNPLKKLLAELPNVRRTVVQLQIGGAVGDGQTLGTDFADVAQFVGGELNLPVPDNSWQTDRGDIALFAGWLTRVCGAIGKIGQDIGLMAQQGIDEIELVNTGISSAMAYKKNPVRAELLVTLSRFCSGLNGVVGQSLVHEQERSGAAWGIEWMTVPQMTMVTGCAIHTAQKVLNDITRIGAAK